MKMCELVMSALQNHIFCRSYHIFTWKTVKSKFEMIYVFQPSLKKEKYVAYIFWYWGHDAVVKFLKKKIA